MPVVATPATPIVVTVDQVRRFMQDYPNRNILLDAPEFTQDEINQGVEMITSLWNSTTPISSITPVSWPFAFQGLLLFGVAWYLLRSAAILQLRNQATYQDGDISPIGSDDKQPQYLAMSQAMRAEWDQMVKDVKIQLNMEAGYGNLPSGYANVSRRRWG